MSFKKSLIAIYVAIGLGCWLPSYEQYSKLKEHPISLDSSTLARQQNEFSGLVLYRKEVLLVPQNSKTNFLNAVYGVDTASINAFINPKKTVSNSPVSIHTTYFFKGLSELRKAMAAEGEVYDGIEAAVVVDNTIYFAIESEKYNCYVVKGTFQQKGDSNFIELGDEVAFRKPGYFPNAGFESIGYEPSEKKLYIFFERNRVSGERTVISFNPQFGDLTYSTFKEPVFFRITDVSHDPSSPFPWLAIQNHYQIDKKEYEFYVGDQTAGADRQMNGQSRQTSFTGILSLAPAAGGWNFQKIGYITYLRQNWEGILHYGRGLLMITDSVPPGPVKFSYFELPDRANNSGNQKKK